MHARFKRFGREVAREMLIRETEERKAAGLRPLPTAPLPTPPTPPTPPPPLTETTSEP
jgi:hypothetical protein